MTSLTCCFSRLSCFILVLTIVFHCRLSHAQPGHAQLSQTQAFAEFGELTELRTDDGRLSFGTIVSADVVSWSAPHSQDLLIARLWDGVYLYPSKDLESFGEPIRLCDQLGHTVLMVEPLDWDGDGNEDVIIGTDRQGNISCLRRVGEFPDMRLEVASMPLRTADGLPFNIPFVNPKYRLADHPENIWPQNFNYTYPTAYRSNDSSAADLIIGDWGGVLWYLPQAGTKDRLPSYAGTAYSKRDGTQYARPAHLLVDEQGQTLLIGEGTENGIRYPGGASRPVMYHNAATNSADLIVVSGMDGNNIRYLKRVSTGVDGDPIFSDLGELTIEDLPDDGYDAYNYHAVAEIAGNQPWPDLLLSRGCDMAVCRNLRISGPKPRFRFDHWISGQNVPTRGYNFTEILTDTNGRRFLLENDSHWSFRELRMDNGKPKLSSSRFPLHDQNGIFRVDGDTDIQHMTRWGFHRAALWDYDGSGQQHLIVGTDKGWLYLLRHEQPLGTNDHFEFRSFGPLKDSNGKVIRIHHRVVAAPLEMNHDGKLDLVLAGATYGTGDPNPGSGIYYVLNSGEASDHSPILSPVQAIETIGHTHPEFRHLHAQLQSLQLPGETERIVVVGTQSGDNFQSYAYRPAADRIALEHTGLVFPPISIEERLLDLDQDGSLEYVRSGGESLIAKYAPVEFNLREESTVFQVTVDRGADHGQNFGSLFEVQTEDGSLTIGAGFQNAWNTRYRADRHAIQFYVRSAGGNRSIEPELLPRPNDLCGTYLYSRDDVVYSTYGGVKAWNAEAGVWRDTSGIGGTEETMRVGSGVLEFGESTVRYDGRTILEPPVSGQYQLFFYADGYLCFYHVDRREGPYRSFSSEADGFSRLYACPWTPEQPTADLTKAIVLTLPVVGETTFAWGVFGKQIVTGSNIGGFYVLENGSWRMLLEPNIGVSYQLYSTMSLGDRLVMGQYPTGRLFEYDGQTITDRAGWPPVPEGVTTSAREAQTTVVCGGEMFVGVWPWGEIWRYNPDADQWHFQQRMFSHPELSRDIVHPYDVENRGNDVSNLWGQRITSLVTSGDSLYVSTSAKYPCEWQADQFPFLADDKWKSYGSVYRLKIPGHLGASTEWTSGSSSFELTLKNDEIAISQDGRQLASTTVTGVLAEHLKRPLKLKKIRWGEGIYGKFNGRRIEGRIVQ